MSGSLLSDGKEYFPFNLDGLLGNLIFIVVSYLSARKFNQQLVVIKKNMNCKEVAIFKFKEEVLDGAVELNKQLLAEMQKESGGTLINFEIYQSPKDPSVFTWLIDWTDAKSAKETTDKWLSFPSNQKFSSSVENDIFYDFLEKR